MAKRINLPALKPHEPGAYSRFPFSMLEPGDELFVPIRRCDKRAVDAAVIRWKKKAPLQRITTTKVDGGTLVKRWQGEPS